METPITEHPRFSKSLKENLDPFMSKEQFIEISMYAQMGGSIAEQILTVEHDKECGLFARWLATDTKYDPNAGWIVKDKNGKELPIYYAHYELIGLFRKERDNG